MSDSKVVTETVKGVIAILALLLITFLYATFVMKSQNDSYDKNREKIERIMDENRLTNNYPIEVMK